MPRLLWGIGYNMNFQASRPALDRTDRGRSFDLPLAGPGVQGHGIAEAVKELKLSYHTMDM